MSQQTTFWAIALGLALVGCSPPAQKAASSLTVPEVDPSKLQGPVYKKQFLSKTYLVDKKYRSMFGPSSLEKLKLLDVKQPELLWIVGYNAVMMNGEGKERVSQEFMCHSNLDFDAKDYWEDFKSNASMSGRLFTLSQGQQDIRFPPGMGIPVMSDTSLDIATQVLNLNLPEPNIEVRHNVTIEFVRDRDVKGEMTPLFQAAVQGFKSLEGKPAHYGMSSEEAPEDHSGCQVGMPAVKGDVDKDRLGQDFTGHWVVKPGREENRSIVTKFLQLQFDTKIHYIAVHLHPFADSLELIDVTDHKTLFKAHAKQTTGKIGLAHVDHFESIEGVPIYKDHDYELISVYDNTTHEDQDSMAVMYLYLHDSAFHKPEHQKPEPERKEAKK